MDGIPEEDFEMHKDVVHGAYQSWAQTGAP